MYLKPAAHDTCFPTACVLSKLLEILSSV